MRPHLRPILPLLAFALASAATPTAAQLRCENIPQLARQYLKNHVSQSLLSPEVEERTIDTYLRRNDPSRSLLLSRDVAEARVSMAGVFNRMREGDCSQLMNMQTRLVERHQQTEEFVRAYVSRDDYAIDESVELLLDPDKRGYPKTAEERDELVRSLVHFQISNYLGAGEPLDEAKRRLVHRYELRSRRVAELEEVELYSSFMDSFAMSLDPHSNYLSSEVLEDFRITMSLSLEGIGVALSERDGYSVVERIIPGGAAARLEDGLRPKDKIIAVAEDGSDPVSIIDMPLREAVSLIRGKKGSRVHLTVLRQEEKTERFPLTIVRDKIDLAEQAAKLRYEKREIDGTTYKLAVIELPSFYGDSNPTQRQCTADMERLLAQVKEDGTDGLLLDLSRNGGGLLEHAVRISGFFIRKGEIVGVQNTRGQLSVLPDRDDRILYSGPMVVHTSRVSASASEILAGALKDYKRAVITGDDHTFGKGTVQTVTPLPPGQGALKITTALFFRPGGRSTQNDGVTADVVIPSLLSSEDFGEKTQRYALSGERIAPFLSSYANAIGPGDRWSGVSSPKLAELSARSSERTLASEEFADIRSKIEEARENDGMIRLADILKEREEAEAEEQNGSGGGSAAADTAEAAETAETAEKTDGAEGEEAEEELSPQVEEALNVLADLVALSRRGT